MNAIFKIKFNAIPDADDGVVLIDTLRSSPNMPLTFKATRSVAGEVGIGSGIDATMFNFAQAFQIDYNNTNLYDVQIDTDLDEITITANNNASDFSQGTNTTGGDVVVTITDAVFDPFNIQLIQILEADTDPCNNVKLSILTSEQATQITSPITQAVSTNPIVIDVPRSTLMNITVTNGNVTQTEQYRIPVMSAAYFDLDVVQVPGGGSLNVSRLYPLSDIGPTGYTFPLTFEYNLDGMGWQAGSSWSGLSVGNHTIQFRDNLGCETGLSFVIDEFTINLIDVPPLAEISSVNPIRFKKDVQWENCGVRKNGTNTLSYEERDRMPIRNYVQLFQTCDIIRTQVKTSYENVEALLVDCDGNETPLVVNKVSENLGITDVRDAQVRNIVGGEYDGRLGIYFKAGDTYDPVTLAQNGTYNLNGQLMEWIDVGDYINLVGFGWLLVDAIIIDSAPQIEGRVVVFNTLSQPGGPADFSTIQTTTMYNAVDFERFEFTIGMSLLLGNYQVRVNVTDPTPGFEDCSFLSEWMDIQVEHPCHYVIDYYNTENNEINFSTGIQFKLRIPYVLQLKYIPNIEQEIYTTDTNTVLLDSTGREFYKFNARPMPTAMAIKLVNVLSLDRVFIDGESYLMEGEPEVIPFGSTNLYQVKANLVKSNFTFNINSGIRSGEIIIPQGEPLAVGGDGPGLLFTD